MPQSNQVITYPITTIAQDITELQGEVETLQTDLTTLEGTVSSLGTGVSTISGTVDAIGNDVTALEDKVFDPTLALTPIMPNGDGQDVETSEDNVAKLNAYLVDKGWHNHRHAIDIEGKRIGLGGDTPFTVPLIAGVGFRTTGLGGTFSENQYGGGSEDTYNVGGLASGFVWMDKDNLTGPMIDYYGYGMSCPDILLQGNTHPLDPTTLVQDVLNRKEEGIRVHGRDAEGKLSTGKIVGNFTVSLFETGIRTVTDPFEDNADQFLIGRLRGHYCDKIFLSENIQTLGSRFDYVDQLHCHTGFEWIRGGKNWIGTHCIQRDCSFGTVIRGQAPNIVGYFNTDALIFDGTSEPDCVGLKIQPDSGYISPTINYGYIDFDANIDSERLNNPWCTVLGFYGSINIYGGSGFYERMFHVTGGVEDFFPTIYIHRAKFRTGSDMNTIRKLFTTTSSGWINVIFVDCHEAFGGGSSANDGKTYNAYRNLIQIYNNNSTVTVH